MRIEKIKEESFFMRKSTMFKYSGFGLILCLVAVTIIWGHAESKTITVKNSQLMQTFSK